MHKNWLTGQVLLDAIMPPLPIDGHQTPLPSGMASVPAQSGGSISLSVIVDFILQRTYHELTVLTELLPRKTDMERKIEIVQFANRTRQLFVRLLALVKWAGSASKVDKCASIMAFLDKQSMLFIDTADMLSRMARETLVHARLPNFQLPCAVEVLTTGSYVRLPTCIKDRILTHDPITSQDKQATLLRLEQIIQHRLVTSVDLPPQMRDLRIENGRVTFHVNQEFEVSLTLMGDALNIPWRLLDIVFLVEDKETGDGRSLVHPLQCRYIIDLVQSRLQDSSAPLYDLYNCLHSFCQSLQLEVLYSQVHRLCQERLGDYVRVVEYTPGKCLSVVFWRELTEKTGVDYKLCIQINSQDNCRPLQLIHSPPLNGPEAQQADQAVKSDLLSFERLLVQTIYVRTKLRLNELKEEIKELLQWNIESTVSGSPAVLNVPILQPCLRSEQLLITLDTHLGIFLAHVPQYAEAPFVDEIKQSLNGNRNQFKSLITNLKFWIVLQRCRKSIQHLPAVAMEKLPLLHSQDHPINQLSRHKLYIKLCKHPNSYLIVELFVKEDNPLEIEENFYLLILEPSTYKESGGNTIAASATPLRSTGPASVGPSEADTPVLTPGSNAPPATPSSASGTQPAENDADSTDKQIPKLFYTIKSLIQFETFAVTHGPYTKVDAGDTMDICRNYPLGKRKLGATSTIVSCKSGADLQCGGAGGSSAKRPKHPAYFLPNLAHVVAMADERIPFAALAEQLTQRGLCHQGLQVEAGGAGLALRLVQMPPCKGLDSSISQALQRVLLGCTIRMQGRGCRTWLIKYSFCKCPISSIAPKEQGPRRQVCMAYDVSPANGASKTVDDIISDWNAIAYMYGAVLEYADYLNKDPQGILSGMAEVKSYSYKRLIFGYGPNKANTVAIYWRSADNRFSLSFGVIGQTSSAVNPHTLTAAQLQHNFNRHKSIPTLLKLLCDTYSPLLSISKLSTAPMYAVTFSRPQQPLPTFTVIPRSPTHLLLSFRNVYCIDVHCRGDGIVAVKDGAYSLFDKSKVVDGFVPTPGLKAFLNKFVDESGCLLRRRSQSEDDNPPSPVPTVDTLDSFMTGHPKPGSPAQRSQEVSGLRFHHPPTPSSSSNPHTPASPHPSVVLPYGSSPVASSSFSLASPPSLHSITPSPGSLLATNSPGNPLHAPSPGSFMPQPSPSGPPVHMQSPVSAYVGGGSAQQHDAGSPYPGGGGTGGGVGTPGGSGLPIASPANQPWPGSPSTMPRPSPAGGRGFGSAQSPGHPALHSPQNIGEHGKGGGASYLRVLPQRSWAASVPTLLSEQAFDSLCTHAPLQGHPAPGSHTVHYSPLHRFLGCVYMRKHLQRCIISEECLTSIPCNEAGVIQFKVDSLQCRVTLNHINFQTVHLKLTPTPDYEQQWMSDEIQCLERFFETRVVCSPYKPNAIVAFARILNAPIQILKDCIQIMMLELVGDRNTKWCVQWCLTIPPAAPPIAPSGMAAVVIARNKLLFFIQLTRNQTNFAHQPELPPLVLPIVYDMTKNTTELADRPQVQPSPTSPTVIVSGMLKRFAERRPNMAECSIFPAVRELVANLEINI
ncbi:Mediator of RNA polymerase II transcription subunit 14 [Chamberlinius hualienensis]